MKISLIQPMKCFDMFDNEINEGDLLDVQIDPIPRKFYRKSDGELYFNPYGKEEKVSAYFKNDLIKVNQ
ncbi:MAG: hypothetical protein MH137_07120 [Flavobacteriales bacterium]|nr:hypothetical protein [Flavobacteriales bacterium]